jgi:hypothetical protein
MRTLMTGIGGAVLGAALVAGVLACDGAAT